MAQGQNIHEELQTDGLTAGTARQQELQVKREGETVNAWTEEGFRAM